MKTTQEETREALSALGVTEITQELRAKYCRAIECDPYRSLNAEPIDPSAPMNVRLTISKEDHGMWTAHGFCLEIGDEIARQAVACRTPRGDAGVEGEQQAKDALARYFQNPDSRIIVGDRVLQGHEMRAEDV